jgi:hypothetical protein
MRAALPRLSAAVLALLAGSAPAQVPCGNLTVTITPNPAPYGAPMTVTVDNNGPVTAFLQTSCAFISIFPFLGGGATYLPNCVPVLTPVPPGGQVSQTWDQKGTCGQQAAPGPYVALVDAVSSLCAIPFTISPCPAGSISSFGTGCGTSPDLCLAPAALTLGDCPLIGTTVTFRLTAGQPSAPSALALGASNTGWTGVPLPIPIGAGCSIQVSLDGVLPGPLTTPTGFGLIPASIPPDPALVGQTVYVQGGAIASPGLFRTTNGLAVTIG